MIYYDTKQKVKFYLDSKKDKYLLGVKWDNLVLKNHVALYMPNRFVPAEPDVFAVDFDGTLCINKYPDIGEPNTELIYTLIQLRCYGNKLILWTCRETQLLQNAVDWCAKHNLYFDAINDNLPESIAQYGNNCRKVSADYYIDDKAVKVIL